VLITINDPLMNNVALFKSLPYDPQRDLTFVAQIVRSPALISASTATGIRSFEDFRRQRCRCQVQLRLLGHRRARPSRRRVAEPELKAQMVHVPQRGEGPVVQDLLANTVSVGLSSVGTAMQHVAAGKIVPLAMMGTQRSTALPNVPTMRELGFKDPLYDAASGWRHCYRPARRQPWCRTLDRDPDDRQRCGRAQAARGSRLRDDGDHARGGAGRLSQRVRGHHASHPRTRHRAAVGASSPPGREEIALLYDPRNPDHAQRTGAETFWLAAALVITRAGL
jgi:hypothetical protein